MDCTISTANDKLHVYSTHDAVEGLVSLKFHRDTNIDHLRINFLGKASVCLKDGRQNPTTAQYFQGEQTFLRMEQPIDAKDLPSNGIALGRRKYRLPFEFTIPETLLPHACNCRPLENGQAGNDHLPLPPTFDSRRQSGSLLSGTYSNQGRIYYVVQVTFRIRFSDGTTRTIQEEKEIKVRPTSRKLDIIAAPEASRHKPMISQPQLGDFEGKAGELQAYTNQPLILTTSPCSPTSTPNTSLLTPLTLIYQPSHSGERPPIVDKVSMNLLCTTSFSAVERSTSHKRSGCRPIQASHTGTKRLRSINLAGLIWTKQQGATTPSLRARETAYSTTLQLPITIHSDPKVDDAGAPLPSFSTCSISRSYGIECSIAYRTTPLQPEQTCSRSVDTLRRLVLARRPQLNFRVSLQICCVDDRPMGKSRRYSGTLFLEDVVADKMLESDRHIEELWLGPPAYHSVVG